MNCSISKNYGMLKIALAAIVWSTQGWIVKAIPWSAISLSGLRALFVAMLLAFLRKNVKWELNKASCLGAISVALTSTLYIADNKLTTAANAVVLQYAMPLFVIGLTWFFRKKTANAARRWNCIFYLDRDSALFLEQHWNGAGSWRLACPAFSRNLFGDVFLGPEP